MRRALSCLPASPYLQRAAAAVEHGDDAEGVPSPPRRPARAARPAGGTPQAAISFRSVGGIMACMPTAPLPQPNLQAGGGRAGSGVGQPVGLAGESQISDSAAPLRGSCTSAPNVLENRDAYYAHERRCGSVAATSRAAAGMRPSLSLADTNAATRPGQEVVSRAGGVRRHSRPTRGAARHRHRWCTDRAAIAGVSRRAGRWSAQPHP